MYLAADEVGDEPEFMKVVGGDLGQDVASAIGVVQLGSEADAAPAGSGGGASVRAL